VIAGYEAMAQTYDQALRQAHGGNQRTKCLFFLLLYSE
jgi:hypothetical protein